MIRRQLFTIGPVLSVDWRLKRDFQTTLIAHANAALLGTFDRKE